MRRKCDNCVTRQPGHNPAKNRCQSDGSGMKRLKKISDAVRSAGLRPGSQGAFPGRAGSETGAPAGNYIARKAVRPSSTMKIANASRMVLVTRMRVSVAVAQLIKSRTRHGVTVNQMPATTNP